MRPHPGPPAPAQRGPHLPLQQLLRPHVLGEELLPGVAVGQRAVAQAACTEGQSGIGGQEEGVPSPQPSPAPLPARPGPFTFPTCQGRGVQAWQPRVLAGRGKRLHTGKERLSVRGSGSRRGALLPPHPLPRTWAFSIRSPGPWPLVPSELCPLPALRILPTLPSLPTLFLSPAGEAGARGSESQLALPTADWQSDAHPGAKLPPRRMYLGCLG